MTRVFTTIHMTLLLGLVTSIAHAQGAPQDSSPPTAGSVHEYVPDPIPKGGGIDAEITLGVGVASEAFLSAGREAGLNWGGAEWSALLSIKATEWSGKACFPFCGPLWTDSLGARLDLAARGVALMGGHEGATDSEANLDLHIEQSTEFALWVIGVGQTFSFQRDAAFWMNFWRPHAGIMTAGVTGSYSLLNAIEQHGHVDVMNVQFDWRQLIQESQDGWSGVADEFHIDIAMLEGVIDPGRMWYERFGLGLVSIDLYGVPMGRDGQTKVTHEATNILFDFALVEGFRVWDAPWKLDGTVGLSALSPIAQVLRNPVQDADGTMGYDYSGGPWVYSPHLWLAVHHVSDRPIGTRGQSLVFEAIPEDADFGVGAGSFQRLDGSALAVDVGAQLAAYGRMPLVGDLTLRGEAVVIGATRSVVSELSPVLPLQPGDIFAMGRLDLGLDWALGAHWLVSANAWLERSDRETSASLGATQLGPTERAGVRAGLLFRY